MTEKHGYDRRKRRMGIAGAALMAVVLCSAGLPAHAEEIPVGVPYGTTIGELKADAPAQCLVVQTGDYTFQKMMAELGDTAVVVQDIGDGTRLCHIPDTSGLDAFIADINTALSGVPAEGEAFYYYDGASNTIQTYPGVSYYQINAAGKEKIYHTLLQILAGAAVDNQTAVLEETDLELTVGDIPEEVAVNKYSLEGSCTTSFKGSSSNRIKNIQIAAGNLNQTVLYPGEVISMNKAFLPRTYANGYREAGAYMSGKVVPAVGGGICQVSSTVYNAAMNSGLTVLERHPHSMPVHYLPLGMDAAISSGSKDLRIRNDYPFPVLFEAYTEGKNLTVNIYTSELMTAGTSYRLHAVRKGSLAAASYLEVTVNGVVTEDRALGTSRYSPMRTDDDDED
ncbi:MAG: VanW family protein [Lachnospiraceae bacterium]|jgi:hypothetical protein|nr:VanW family protein [Lachnospiraceae bacterium]